MVMGDMVMTVDVVVIGAGPAGCSAAFRAAELGHDVALIDAHDHPGGNYLNKTSIPTKIYREIACEIQRLTFMQEQGVFCQVDEINFEKISCLKETVITKQQNRLINRCKDLGILLVKGSAFFENSTSLRLKDSEFSRLKFKHAIVATGAFESPSQHTGNISNPNIINATDALQIEKTPGKVLIVGAGPNCLELGCIYAYLGGSIDIATVDKQLLRDVDNDLSALVTNNLTKLFNKVLLNTEVTEITEDENGVHVTMISSQKTITDRYDTVIYITGRKPSSGKVGLENTKVKIDYAGFIVTDEQQRTADSNIFAAGDVTDARMLDCISDSQGKIAAEVISGLRSAFDAHAIPNTIDTIPPITWCGVTEKQASVENFDVTVKTCNWTSSATAALTDSEIGLTKIIADKHGERILGVGIVGPGAKELISEGVLAIEMGALVEDLALTLHPHNSFASTLKEAASLFSIKKQDAE